MAKESTSAAPVATEELSLEEFCTRLSETEKRPEAIGGFYYVEKSAGRLRGDQAGYTSRFGDFLNKPV